MLAEWSVIDTGDAGIAQTLARMRRLAMQATQDPRIVQLARRIVAHEDGHDRWGTTAALFTWFTARYVYTLDPTGYELVVAPDVMLRLAHATGQLQGDCDDAVTLLAALLESVGVSTRFRVVSTATPAPGDSGYGHVLVEALTEAGTWWPLDATLDGAQAGDRPPRQAAEAIYDETGFHVEARPMIRRMGRLGQFESDFVAFGGGGVALDSGQFSLTSQPASLYTPGQFDLGVSPVLASPDIMGGSGYTGYPAVTPMPAPGGTDWTKIFGDVSGAVVKIGAGALPLLERYGALTPAPGSVPLQYPGETSQQYAARIAAGGFGNILATTPSSTWLLLGGGALLLVLLMRRKS